MKFPCSANVHGNSLTVLAIREPVFGLEAPRCLMEAVYIAALSLFSDLVYGSMLLFLPHGCLWELQCEVSCTYLRQIYIIREVKKSSK